MGPTSGPEPKLKLNPANCPEATNTRESSLNHNFPARARSCGSQWIQRGRNFLLLFSIAAEMKKAGIFAAASVAAASVAAASVSAASSVALSSGSDSCAVPPFKNEVLSLPSGSKEAGAGSRMDGGVDRFAPRFDGLRFIETLVTAHR